LIRSAFTIDSIRWNRWLHYDFPRRGAPFLRHESFQLKVTIVEGVSEMRCGACRATAARPVVYDDHGLAFNSWL
jgi:hypothetical protein